MKQLNYRNTLKLGMFLFFFYCILSCAPEGPYRQMRRSQVKDETKARKAFKKEERKNTKAALKADREKKKSKEWKEYEKGLKRHYKMQHKSTKASMKSYKKRNKNLNRKRKTNPHRSFWDWLFGRNKSKYQKRRKSKNSRDEWAG